MALNAFLSLKAASTGVVKGSVVQKGREGKIQVIAASHRVSTAHHPATGQATGKNLHHPFVITKELDQSSPIFYTLLKNNEAINDWELQFFGMKTLGSVAGGTETHQYSVKLANALIVDIRFVLPNTKDAELSRFKEYEEISFAYEKIEWIWIPGNKSASDDWI